jgi:hypothetical protein
MSHLADNTGRKRAEMISWSISITGIIILLLSVNLYMVGIGSFFMGLGTNAAITLHYSFFKELVLGKTRSKMIIAIQVTFSLGVFLISLLSMQITNWKVTLGFFILIPSLLICLSYKFIE